VSRLSSDFFQIALSPHQVAMVRFSRGWKSSCITERKLLPCQPTGEQQSNWNAPLAALRDILPKTAATTTPVRVILSNHFLRYVVLPWSPELVTRSEELDYAHARFTQVFGDRARQWVVRTSDAPAGAERLGAATDAALLEALPLALGASGLTLSSCQPALMAQFNTCRQQIRDNAWLVGAERGRLLIARISKQRWRSVRIRPLNEAVVPLRDLLEQERLLLSANESGYKIFVSAADDVVIDNKGLRPEQLGKGSSSRPADAPYALAMAGL
jgi:hypothetical protein